MAKPKSCEERHEGGCEISYEPASNVVAINDGRVTFRICAHCLIATLDQIGVRRPEQRREYRA